ncbi:hypothetical protein ACDZ28_32790 [Paenibacillus sp. RS8]|uniref:hypothetical protein n=1 Tax=Paenibacillus sp. RS8 TaxID=3242681 RepID=UPI0035C062E1
MFKFQFHCHNCSETFRISIVHLHSKDEITCPNCVSRLPEKALDSLRQLSESFMDAVDVIYNNNSTVGWGLSIISDEIVIPSSYDHLNSAFMVNKDGSKTLWNHRAVEREISFDF